MSETPVALVTGSTRGIGWATASRLAEAGTLVILNGRRQQDLDARVDELRQRSGDQCEGLLFDITNEAQTSAAYRHIFERYGRLDVLVNNAGVQEDALIGMITRAVIDHLLAVNVSATVMNLQAAARLMRRRRAGSIINVSSIMALNGAPGQTAYSASKAAIVGVTRSAAKELAPVGIRVNAVAPGYIDTDMTRRLPADLQEQRLDSISMGRAGTPEDVAGVITFLASDDSAYVTGQIIGVDGGMVL